jgi:ligand-binding sensor domain-containing protein
LWRTENSGQSWSRISSGSVIVNDVLLNSAEPGMVMLATDRVGVLMSNNSAKTFAPSNAGFTHRQVASVAVDIKNGNRLYAGTLNDRESGGVFVSDNGGSQWQQMSNGLGGHDVFKVRQDEQGNLFAATNGGLFRYNEKGRLWMKVLPARMDTRLRVSDLDLNGTAWFLATADGLYSSKNHGVSWQPVGMLGKQSFIAVRTNGGVTAAASNSKVFVSTNQGKTWEQIHIPLVSYVSAMTLDGNGYVWLNSPQGVFRQLSDGWEKVRDLPQDKVAVLDFDRRSGTVVAITRDANKVLVSNDGRKWRSVYSDGVPVRSVAFGNDRMFAGTAFDGVVTVDLEHNRRSTPEIAGGSD